MGKGHPALPTLHPFNFWGTSSPRTPPELCPWTTLGDFRSRSSPIAVFSGNESLCFSLRLCFSNDVCSALNSWRTRNRRTTGWMTMTKLLVLICLYCLKCAKFGRVILRKIINIVATRCQILRLLIMHQIRFRLGLCPRPRLGAHSAPPDPVAGLKGPTSKGKGRGREGEGKGRGKAGKGRGNGGRTTCVLHFY